LKSGLTEIVMIVDESGSMGLIRDDAIGSFNSFIDGQREGPGEAQVTLATFNGHGTYKMVYVAKPIAEVEPLTKKNYQPGGSTALLEAMCLTIDRVGARLSDTPEEKRPEKVIVLTITDGQENDSPTQGSLHLEVMETYSKEKLRAKITHQHDKYRWEFAYLTCDEAAIQDAYSYGYHNVSNYVKSAGGMRSMSMTLGANVNAYRATGNFSMPTDIPEGTTGTTGNDTATTDTDDPTNR